MALVGEVGWSLLLILIGVKILATSITLGAGGSGGVFAPSLFIGAMVGGAFGTLVMTLFPAFTTSSGAYALMAMGAVVAATTRAPITSILIIFELTNDYKMILPLMIACIISMLISAYLMTPSIYTMKLLRRGVDLDKGQEANVLRSLTVQQAKSTTFETISPQAPLGDLLIHLAESPHSGLYIVNEAQRYTGVVTFDNIRNLVTYGNEIDGLLVAHDITRFDVRSVTDDEKLDRLMLMFGQHRVDAFPVVAPSTGHLIGVVDREHVMDAHNREVTRRDLAGEFSSMVATFTDKKVVQLGDNYAMVEIDTPKQFIGKSIAQLHIRRQYGVQILLIKQPNQHSDKAHFVPTPDYVIVAEDVLLLARDQANIQRARNL